MKYNLAAMVKRARPGTRRRQIVLREAAPPPATMATDLFRACYLPILTTIEAAVPRIMEEYARTLAEITTDSPADVQAGLDGLGDELRRLVLNLTPRLRDWVLRVEGWVRGRWRGAVLSATGVDLQTLLGPEDARVTIETAIARNVALIKDVSTQAQGRISEAVFRGLNQRKPAREVAAEVREAVAMSRRRALNIAAHQLSDISNRLADERRREAGIGRWMWVHSQKLHPRPAHVARNGKVYADTEAGAGEGALPPPEDRPGELPHCGCRSRSVLTFD